MTPGIFPKGATSYPTDTYSAPLIALVTTAKKQEQPKCPTTDEWLVKMWCTHTTGNYSALKKNESMNFVSKWSELENIILNDVTQTQRDNCCTLPLIGGY